MQYIIKFLLSQYIITKSILILTDLKRSISPIYLIKDQIYISKRL